MEIDQLSRSGEPLTDDEFLAHMRRVFAAEPSLAQRVGKHYARENWDPLQKKQIVAMPIVNPELDYEKLARALLEQVRYERLNGKNTRRDSDPSGPQTPRK